MKMFAIVLILLAVNIQFIESGMCDSDFSSSNDVRNIGKFKILGQGAQGLILQEKKQDTVLKINFDESKTDYREISFLQKIFCPDTGFKDPLGGKENIAKLVNIEKLQLPDIIFFKKGQPKKMKSKVALAIELQKYNENLMDLIKRKTLAPKVLKKLVIDILRGLVTLHANGYIHKDLKFDNVLIKKESEGIFFKSSKYTAVITDFGLTEFTKDEKKASGTPCFLPPEVFSAVFTDTEQKYGRGFDVWSFGIMLYMLISPNSALLPCFREKANIDYAIGTIELLKNSQKILQYPQNNYSDEFGVELKPVLQFLIFVPADMRIQSSVLLAILTGQMSKIEILNRILKNIQMYIGDLEFEENEEKDKLTVRIEKEKIKHQKEYDEKKIWPSQLEFLIKLNELQKSANNELIKFLKEKRADYKKIVDEYTSHQYDSEQKGNQRLRKHLK